MSRETDGLMKHAPGIHSNFGERIPGQSSYPKGDCEMGGKRGKKANGLLAEVTELLESGLETQTEPFPETEKQFAAILDQLRELDPDDIKGRLVIAGFVSHPHGPEQQRCQECIYYLVHRKWCDIPEVSLPCQPDWWCRLWRI